MDAFTNKDFYKDKLQFQGSNDGFNTDISPILTVGEELHEGWMYYRLDDTDLDIKIRDPRFRAYRLFNAESNGCDMLGEMHLIG